MQSPRASRSVSFVGADRVESLRHLGAYLRSRTDSGSGREQFVAREVPAHASEDNASELLVAKTALPQGARLGEHRVATLTLRRLVLLRPRRDVLVARITRGNR